MNDTEKVIEKLERVVKTIVDGYIQPDRAVNVIADTIALLKEQDAEISISQRDATTNDREIGSKELIMALDSVTWYNGLAEIIVHWKDEDYFDTDHNYLSWKWQTFRSYDTETQNQLEVIWIICVELFGNYGTSPRSGWIENKAGFYRFIDDITKTYRE